MLCTVHASMVRMGWGWPRWPEWVCTDLGVPIGVAQHVMEHRWTTLDHFGPVGTGLSSFGAPGQQATSYKAFGLPRARVLPMLCTVHASMVRMGWDGQNGLVVI